MMKPNKKTLAWAFGISIPFTLLYYFNSGMGLTKSIIIFIISFLTPCLIGSMTDRMDKEKEIKEMIYQIEWK